MTFDPHPVYVLILAGGAGTRFWPASRAACPKQLLPLLSESPLLVETANRVLPLCGADGAGFRRLLVASGRHLEKAIVELLPELPRDNLLIEPVARNTAACIGWATVRLAERDPDAVVMVVPSDHHIADVDRFRGALERAVASARRGVITTIGIRPTHPETGYGYIEVGGEPALSGEALAVRRFVEKPQRALAEQFVASGRYLWNAGMFFFRARDMLAAMKAHQPALAKGLSLFERALERGSEPAELSRIFSELPSISIDKGVMEHMAELAVIPGDFGWSDVGSWQSAWELAKRDALGNAAPAGTVLLDAKNNHVVDRRSGEGRKRVIALVGVDDLVVVETDDALLIVPRGRAQDVKEVVERLKERGDTQLI